MSEQQQQQHLPRVGSGDGGLHFASIIEGDADGVTVFSSDWRYLYLNPAAERMVRRPRAELLGRVVWDIWPQARASPEYEPLVRAMRERAVVVEQVRSPSRPHVWYEVRCVPLPSLHDYDGTSHDGTRHDGTGGGGGLVVYWRDVSAVRQAQSALQASERLLREVAEAAPCVTWVVGSEGGVEFLNQRWYERTGLGKDASLGWGWPSAVHPDDLERVRTEWDRARRAAEDGGSNARAAFEAEYRLLHSAHNGSLLAGLFTPAEPSPELSPEPAYRWHLGRSIPLRDGKGRVVKWVGAAVDIHDRKVAEERVAEQAALLDLAQDAIIVRALDGTIRFWNPAAEKLYGWSAEEVMGRSTHELLQTRFPESRDALDAALLSSGLWEGELTHTARDGRLITVASRQALRQRRHGTDGAPDADVLEVNRDVTALRVAADALLTQRAQVAEAFQRSLMATAPPTHAFSGLEVATVYAAAWDEALVGGDWVDVSPLADGRIALCVGDVTGKGAASAAYAVEMRAALKAYLREHARNGGAGSNLLPADALWRLNQHTLDAQEFDGKPANVFACVTLAVIDPATGRVALSVAGGEPPLVLRAETGEVEEVMAGRGPLIGITPEWDAASASAIFGIGPGDLLLLTTDGLTEARSGGRSKGANFLGAEGVAHSLRAAASGSGALASVSEAVVADVLAFAGGRRHDDVCLLLARRQG